MSHKPEPQATTLSLTPRAERPESDQETGGDPAGDCPPVTQQLRRAVADLALQTTREGVWLIDKLARTTFVNERIAHLFGYTVHELLKAPLIQLLDEEGQRTLLVFGGPHELRARRKDGSPIWLLVSTTPVYDPKGEHTGSLAMVSDLSEQKATQQALTATVADLERRLEETRNEVASAKTAIEGLVYRDALTGLYNRRYFDERLAQEAERCKRHVRRLCLLFIDVDDFKHINDNYGHLAGDQALRGLGRALVGPTGHGVRPLLRSSDIAARYGGDEITILAPETSLEGGHTLAERILDRVRSSAMLSIETKPLSLAISIGVAVCPLHAAIPEELVASADRAMYQAKRQGGGRVCFAETAS
jgi:diguanylate cyclase (GGDEF)-like protein/PAS domain S-box-containing protein